MNAFLLHLQGPMQSSGDTGFGQIRQAGPFPSRASVIGLLAAALGIERGGERLLDLHRDLRVHVATVRAGTLGVDYHTVLVAGYQEYDPVRLRREGVADANPILTDRTYHLDAHFIALVESDDAALIDECRNGLHRPVFTAYLGRRSCPPATPLLPIDVGEKPTGEGSDPRVDALIDNVAEARKKRHRGWNRWEPESLNSFHAYFDGGPPNDSRVRHLVDSYRRDLLVALPRSYVNRSVAHVHVDLPDEARAEASDMNESFFNDAP